MAISKVRYSGHSGLSLQSYYDAKHSRPYLGMAVWRANQSNHDQMRGLYETRQEAGSRRDALFVRIDVRSWFRNLDTHPKHPDSIKGLAKTSAPDIVPVTCSGPRYSDVEEGGIFGMLTNCCYLTFSI